MPGHPNSLPVPPPRARSLGRVPARTRRQLADLLLAPLYRLYTNRLRREVKRSPLPTHIAVILDGNRRWASLVGLREPSAGHRAGADKATMSLATVSSWLLDQDVTAASPWHGIELPV